jgi:hypothetical protein
VAARDVLVFELGKDLVVEPGCGQFDEVRVPDAEITDETLVTL